MVGFRWWWHGLTFCNHPAECGHVLIDGIFHLLEGSSKINVLTFSGAKFEGAWLLVSRFPFAKLCDFFIENCYVPERASRFGVPPLEAVGTFPANISLPSLSVPVSGSLLFGLLSAGSWGDAFAGDVPLRIAELVNPSQGAVLSQVPSVLAVKKPRKENLSLYPRLSVLENLWNLGLCLYAP